MLTRPNDLEYRRNGDDDSSSSSESESESESSSSGESDYDEEFEGYHEEESGDPSELEDLSHPESPTQATINKQKTISRLFHYLNKLQKPLELKDMPSFKDLHATTSPGFARVYKTIEEARGIKPRDEDEVVTCVAPGAYIDGDKDKGKRFKARHLTFNLNSALSEREKYRVNHFNSDANAEELEKYQEGCNFANKFYGDDPSLRPPPRENKKKTNRGKAQPAQKKPNPKGKAQSAKKTSPKR